MSTSYAIWNFNEFLSCDGMWEDVSELAESIPGTKLLYQRGAPCSDVGF